MYKFVLKGNKMSTFDELLAEEMKNFEFKKEYEALEKEFSVINFTGNDSNVKNNKNADSKFCKNLTAKT